MVQPEEKTKAVSWAKRIAVIQGLFTLAFVMQFIMESRIDPVYGLPVSVFSQPLTLTKVLDLVVPYAVVLLGLAVVVFTVLAWWKSYWKLAGRIHYTLFALACMILTWIFYFWKVI